MRMAHLYYRAKCALLFLVVFITNRSKYVMFDTYILAIFFLKEMKTSFQYHQLYKMLGKNILDSKIKILEKVHASREP